MLRKSTFPKTCPLPQQYLKPQIETYFVGLPFWEMQRPYKNLVDVPIGEKGNDCLGCEPGSGPGPFIVVYNDGKQMGFIYPYVFQIEQNPDVNETSFVDDLPISNGKRKGTVIVKVGGDTLQKDESMFKEVSTEYEIHYMTYEEMRNLMNQMCCFNFGSFGNCGLPKESDTIKLDGYFLML